MASFVDVCKFTPVSSGTGDFVVSLAVTGYQTPADAGAVDGEVYRYRAENSNLSEWEVGYGVYTSSTTTLARTVIVASSNSGSAVNFSTIPQIGLVALSSDMRGQPGDIIITFDSSVLNGFAELDGSTITGGATTYPIIAARYSWMVSSTDLILPDMRGRVLRSWDHGAGVDPDAASRTARAGDGQTGDYPGTYQADAFKSHNHTFGTASAQSGSVAGLYVNSTGAGASTGATGGSETRMKNINVMYQMKLG